MKSKPIAVLISDIHFTPKTLEEATAAFKQAQDKASELKVTLVVMGDTLDSKAVIRAECANRLISLLLREDAPHTKFLVGNHDLCNERGIEHALNFLKPYANVIDKPRQLTLEGTWVNFVPYQSGIYEIKSLIDITPKSEGIWLMHQGVMNSDSGEYFKDPTAVPGEWFDGLRVVSGHYHKRQSLTCGATGTWDYVGNPYTLSFAEANDPEKGFQVLYDDGKLEFFPTNLRKHVILGPFDVTLTWNLNQNSCSSNDIILVKLTGPSDKLAGFTKEQAAEKLGLAVPFKLDLIPYDEVSQRVEYKTPDQAEILDSMIDSLTNVTDTRKKSLKELWRELKCTQ